MLETEPVDGDPCRFRTCFPVTVWPLELAAAGYHGFPYPVPATPFAAKSRSVIRLELKSLSPAVSIRDFELGHLRFYLNAPSSWVYQLYELIFNNSVGLSLSSSANDRAPLLLDRSSIKPVGFERDHGLVDHGERSFPGYPLLGEFFAFPEKFLFFDVEGLGHRSLQPFDKAKPLLIHIFLDRHLEDLERYVTTETFQLGCCPMINLFRQRAEPIRLTQSRSEYRVVPDARRPLSHEIYSIDKVTALNSENEEIEFSPFFSLRHQRTENGRTSRFWHASRQPATAGSGQNDDGTEVALSFVDLEFNPAAVADWTVDVETTCLNRDLPGRLPFGGGQPQLFLSEGGPLKKIVCLTPPSKTRRPAFGYGTLWRLISHLSLNHLSLFSSDGDPQALQEILRLYDFVDSEETRNVIDGLISVRAQRVVGRPGGPVSGGFCRGLEVNLQFDEDKFSGSGMYLFGSVLERFLGLYSSINSFTQTIVTTNRRDRPLCQWPPRAGEQVFL
jgi:type VI secretion system protein ImpG